MVTEEALEDGAATPAGTTLKSAWQNLREAPLWRVSILLKSTLGASRRLRLKSA